MAFISGARHGPYEIISALGAGGMGEVYRARDTKLDREVALKVLPDFVVADHERVARFTREAKTLAALNHPNIGGIYGLEEANGVAALVMELIEGEDLAQRIARGAIPLDEALPIARQIADALEAAHELGIIHRDLKPANIKLRPDGTVKVLDFGLAKARAPDSGSAAASRLAQSPTITSPATVTGVGIVLGTAAYMAPEQARGQSADNRSDVWSFGCVLYEMLAGQRAFAGDGVSDTLANVLKTQPDWTKLPDTTPPAIQRLLRRGLEKERKRRLADIADARLEIEDAMTNAASDARVVSAGLTSAGSRRVSALTIAALVVGGAAAGTTVWLATRPPSPGVIRTAIPTQGAITLGGGLNGQHLTITPDGSRVLYRGAGEILVRGLDQLEATAIPGLGAPLDLFTSPDGQWVGYFDGFTSLKKVAITGGPAVTLAPLDGLPRGAAWGANDTIVFATNTQATGLQRVAAAGGEVTVLTTPDRARGEADHVLPQFLPDGQTVLFTITAVSGGLEAAQIAVLDQHTGTQTVLLRGGSHARYVPTGHLVYGAGGALLAVAFDLRRLAVVGSPVPVLASVAMNPAGVVEVGVARNGTLAYLPGGVFAALAERSLVWVDRQGREERIPAPSRAYQQPRISPDGTRVALVTADQEQDLWVWDLVRTTLTRLTFDPALDQAPLWMPDSQRIVFSSARSGVSSLYVQAADGTGTATPLTESRNAQFATSITRDGARVVFFEATPTQARDLRLLHLTPTPRVEPLLETRADEYSGVVSPDGRWLAYESNSGGPYEIYVRPFPAVSDGMWQVSTGGGAQPLWAPRGQELFYVARDGSLMSVPVERRVAGWSAGAPARLLGGRTFRAFRGEGNVSRRYDVTADAQRFLMIQDNPVNAESSAQIIVVQNWFEELKSKVPTK